MKKILLLGFILLGSLPALLAQTVTVTLNGTVLRDSTYLPVASHQVIIQADSNANGFTFYTTRMTSASGHYDCVIHNVPTANGGVTFTVETKNCDSTSLVQSFLGSSTPDTINFLICNGNTSGCEAAFGYSLDSASLTTVYFYDNSTPVGQIHEWNWNFGDGTTQSVVFPNNPNVTHTYATAGTYTACLTIHTISNACTSTVCHEIHVGQNTECQAAYTHYADSTNLLHVHFYDASTPQNLIISREWTFGDGGTASTFDPWHIYEHPGRYLVCLTIATSTGCSSHHCDSLTVGSNEPNCESWFTYTGNFLTLTFEGHTHSIYPTTYEWNFGDGSATVTGPNVSHTYASAGAYTVTLHSLDSIGCEYNYTSGVYAHATVDLNGYVLISNSIYADHGLVELYRVDSIGNISLFNSTVFGDSLGMYWFGLVPQGHYYLKASLLPASIYYGQYAPTYYVDAVNWNNATLIELGQPANPYNIMMAHVMNYTSGPGNIHGTIIEGGKSNSIGAPASNLNVLLLDGSGQLLAFTVTDSLGAYSFPEVAYGTYRVYPEMIGKTTTPTTVVLSESYSNANVSFTVHGNNILGIHEDIQQADFEISDVSPNPVSEMANLTIRSIHQSEINVTLYSITGMPVKEFPFTLHTGSNKISIATDGLSKGLYYLKIDKGNGSITVKKFIVSK